MRIRVAMAAPLLGQFLTGSNNMENLIYWNGKAVGIDCGSYVSWFPSAPREAIQQLTSEAHMRT